MSTKNYFSKFCSARTASFTHLTQSVKKWGLSACTMTTSKKSLQSFPTMCVIPLLLHRGKIKKNKKNIATQQFPSHESELTGKFGPQITNTYTKPKGLLVMRKSFLPWLTRRFKTASVSLPLRMNSSVHKKRTKYLLCSSVLTGYREVSYVLPRSSMIHLYMYPLRWTMPIASWGLHTCTSYRAAYTYI